MNWRTHAKIISGLVIVGLGGGIWYLATPTQSKVDFNKLYGPVPDLSNLEQEAFPSIVIAKVVGWQGAAKPEAAPGLTVAEFARDLDHPRWMKLLPNGDVLVAESTQPSRPAQGLGDRIAKWIMQRANGSSVSANRITLLRDSDGDGKIDLRSALLTAENGLNSPFGMELVGDTLYIANTDSLMAFPYKTGDTKISAKGEKIVPLPSSAPNNHWTRNVIASPDQKTLLVTVGSNSNIGENGLKSEEYRANVLEVYPKQKTFRIFTAGLRNPNGLAYEPKTGYLWTTVNERDQLGPDTPPDYLATVDFGGHYGWPWFYWRLPDHRVQPQRLGQGVAGAHARVQRNEGVTSARQASSKLHVFAAVAEQNRNRRLVGKSHAGDEVGHLVGARIKFGVGPGAVAIDDRGGLGLGNGEFAYAVSDVERIATRKQRHSSSKKPLPVGGHPAPSRWA